MTDESRRQLLEIAEKVADGQAVDWPQEGQSDDQGSGAVQGLRLLEEVASAFREAAPAGAEPAAGAPPIDRWGELEIVERLAAGSFGEVFRARDPGLEREVALKLRRAEAGPGGPAILDEARRLARVRHPNVLTVHGAAVHNGRVGMWTDLVAGETLEERLVREGALGPREAAAIGIELCGALAAVHAEGLVHGDLTAANVMRERGGRIVLMDFGAVSELWHDATPACSPAYGTPLFLAPEVLSGGSASPAADVYALGVLLYHVVSGAYPVEATSFDDLCARLESGHTVPLTDRRPDLPVSFLAVVERALATDPAARFPSAGAMQRALTSALEAESSPTGDEAPTPRRSAPRHRRPLVIALGVALGMTGAAGVALLAGGARARPATPISVEAALHRSRAGVSERLTPGHPVAPGDSLWLELATNEPAWVYVLNEDERGELFVLYPLEGCVPANPVPAGRRHRLPGRIEGVTRDWQVTSAGGREAILVVAGRRPVPDLELAVATCEAAGTGADAGGAMPVALRGIGGVVPAGQRDPGDGKRLQALEQRLRLHDTTKGGLWLQRFELPNPGSQ